MSEIKLIINGIEAAGQAGDTILTVARGCGVEIPTLCYDERVEVTGSCGICVVEVEGNPRLLRACSTVAMDGMVIWTETPRVVANRKTVLALLLSDHTGDCRGPCVLACPGQTDCQGYVRLIAEGKVDEALSLIYEQLPLPACIGRVCPHPCEDACRRALVEEPIAIAHLKTFAGDIGLAKGGYHAKAGEDTGKRVAIVGGGPGGLTAAYFLRLKGHGVTIYDAMPKMGGMLRYGIPEYRLPKAILDAEISVIERMGVAFRNEAKLGRDVRLGALRVEYDAVIIAMGAWQDGGLRCPGEDLDDVLGGIGFLLEAAKDRERASLAGKKVAVVGGGNTAMDVCRTAVRLGADVVYNIYRRTRNEMPAEEIEIMEAEEEGVIFKSLVSPMKVIGEDGKVKALQLQVMDLGEPDASGRRAPVAVEGEEEVLHVDVVIAATGQKLNPAGLEGLELTKGGTIAADEQTYRTSLEGVFAVGDATNQGADIAIAAIGEAHRAADMVDAYLQGEAVAYTPPYLVKDEKMAEDFADREKIARVKMPHRPAAERRVDFGEVNLGLTEEEARAEGQRCLKCGCGAYGDCKLLDYANGYAVQPEKFDGKMHARKTAEDIPGIMRNPDKCVLCGLCVRVCDEVAGEQILGFVGRGFDTVISPAGDVSPCAACGKCGAVCPTGALLAMD